MIIGIPESDPYQNQLLAALTEEERQRLFPYLVPVHLPPGKVLYESGETLHHVYFPTNSIVSLLHLIENGATAEVSMIGNEGLVGIALAMGADSTLGQAVVHAGGFAYQLPAQRLMDEFNRHGKLMLVVLRYTQCLITQMAQIAVCNRHHNIEQRLCRWLLQSLDRLPDNRLDMTQELISHVLGTRREGVTAAAGKLQNLGILDYSRGHILVLDRGRLEQLSCECYAAVKREADRLRPPPGHH